MNQKVIAVILARGGSKGIPRKNLRLLAGKPLIVHTILDAREAELVDCIYVSTEDPEIAGVSKEYGAEIIQRPLELATDTAASAPALAHALTEIERGGMCPDLIVFLQCTAPIRTGKDIDMAIRQLQNTDADSLLSVSPSHKFLWEKSEGYASSINYDYRYRPRRQDMKTQFVENGSIYVCKPWVVKQEENWLGGKIDLFVMSENCVDIDSLLDFEIAELILNKEQRE